MPLGIIGLIGRLDGSAAAPVIGSVVPAFAPDTGGSAHVLNGTGFALGATLQVDGAPVACAFVSSVELTFTAPVGTFGLSDLLVTNPSTLDSGVSGVGLLAVYVKKDLTLLSDGTHASVPFAAATGLALTRAATAPVNQLTLRDSASSVISGIGANVARVFNDGAHRGLLIEQRQHNYAGHARNITSGWAASAQGTQTGGATTGADGTAAAASHVSLTSSQVSNFFDLGLDTVNRSTLSSMQKSADPGLVNGDMQSVYMNAANTAVTVGLRAASLAWGFVTVAKQGALRRYIVPVETYDTSGFGGQTARSRNVYIDFMQVETGDFATSCILGGSGVTRDNDYLAWPSFPTTGNRLRLYLRFAPLFSSTSQVPYLSGGGLDLYESGWYLYEAGAVNYMYIKDSDKKLYCKLIGGAEVASTNAVSFTQWDEVEFLILVGNNASTFLKYRVNGGAWTNLVMAAMPGDATPSTALTAMASPVNNTTSMTLPCLLRELRAYPAELTEADL